MGGIAKSVGGFLGLGGGPDAPPVQTQNLGLDQLNRQNSVYGNAGAMGALNNYAMGNGSAQDAMGTQGLSPEQQQEMGNALATGATTGSRFATDQVMNNPMMAQTFGKGGTLDRTTQQEQDLSSKGFSLQPEDHEAYGQASGNIARLFGTQEQGAAQSLASRGLGSAPSGAAGVAFSGLQGNKDEQLAQSQMQIAQARMNMNQQRLGQTRQFLSQLNQQGQGAIDSQYHRQLAGATAQKAGLEGAAGQQNAANKTANEGNMAAANFEQENKPQNLFDMAQGGINGMMGSAAKTVGEKTGAKAATSLFGA